MNIIKITVITNPISQVVTTNLRLEQKNDLVLLLGQAELLVLSVTLQSEKYLDSYPLQDMSSDSNGKNVVSSAAG